MAEVTITPNGENKRTRRVQIMNHQEISELGDLLELDDSLESDNLLESDDSLESDEEISILPTEIQPEDGWIIDSWDHDITNGGLDFIVYETKES